MRSVRPDDKSINRTDTRECTALHALINTTVIIVRIVRVLVIVRIIITIIVINVVRIVVQKLEIIIMDSVETLSPADPEQ